MLDARMPASRALVVIPTYNEIESLGTVLDGIAALSLGLVDVLVVDDASPDGTGDLADAYASRSNAVHVLHRAAKNGLGRAYLDGFDWGLDRGYAVLVEMDADGSHPIDRLGPLIERARTSADLSIGSRWVPGGSVTDWSRGRELLSRGGNRYARAMLGIDVQDSTAGFRAYRADLLRRMHLDDVHSRGYCFQIDMTLRALDAGARVEEIPIAFRERAQGESKMSRAIVAEAMLRVTWWGVERFIRAPFARARAKAGRTGPAGATD